MALIEAALQIVRESGVKSVTHRKVCSYAGVALGSSTYHYENLDNLILDAFAHYVEDVSSRYEDNFAGATSDDDLIDAVLQLTEALTTDMGNAILEWELLAAAGRETAYRALAQKWSERARSAVQAYVSPQTAHMLEVIWDGATVQRVLNGKRLTDAELRRMVRAVLELDDSRSYPKVKSDGGRSSKGKAAARTRRAAASR
ncbi:MULTISPECIES: TetR/AcrR family transcriptional regulator [Mycolicibacterium]|nr:MULTISPECIES: TetR family transcriptional regulator [Mycolicibacterium]MCW1824421.1 TetR family transcriptional regulator [Mycolicibacterium senegalense]